jgi:hypothetical protein
MGINIRDLSRYKISGRKTQVNKTQNQKKKRENKKIELQEASQKLNGNPCPIYQER